jgi:hypothetical protein
MQQLSTIQCTLLGAVGASVVAVATYPLSGSDSGYTWLLVDASTVERVGFGLRLLAFAGFGAFWGYLHRPEHDLKRAFQIGIAAPAAIMGMVYANDVGSGPAATDLAQRPVLLASAGDRFPVRVGPSDKRSVVDQLVKGILGK